MPHARKSHETRAETTTDLQHANTLDKWNDPSPLTGTSAKPAITIEAVNRVLEVGRMLRSVLTEEELSALSAELNAQNREKNTAHAKAKRRSRKAPDEINPSAKK
jgi:hypothetical protein